MQQDCIIFDGSLFHHPINDLMRNYHATVGQITYHVNTLVQALETLQSQVIYLSCVDIEKRLRRARLSRDEAPPSAEQLMFWERRKIVDSAVMQQLQVQCDIFDISAENWDTVIDVVTSRI